MKGHFLQSEEWEEFQKSVGRKTWRADGMLVVRMPLAAGMSYLYAGGVPGAWRPPWHEFSKARGMGYGVWREEFLKDLRDIAREQKVVFFRFEPMSEDTSAVELLQGAGFVRSAKAIQPQRTIVLDSRDTEEELLANMRQKTRYNIGLAQKKDLRFTIYDSGIKEKVFEDFLRILEKTKERDNFSLHSKEYYRGLLKLSLAKFAAVSYREKMIAANIVLFYEGRVTYLHGASDYEYRALMAPYLLHWETIRYAKERGFSEYDFWGIDEGRWPGLTRFKRGFGGRQVEYAGSYDYVFQPVWYGLYQLCGLVGAFAKNLKLKI